MKGLPPAPQPVHRRHICGSIVEGVKWIATVFGLMAAIRQPAYRTAGPRYLEPEEELGSTNPAHPKIDADQGVFQHPRLITMVEPLIAFIDSEGAA
jgi:hypothetical protein